MNTFGDDLEDRPVRDSSAFKSEQLAKKTALKLEMVAKMDRNELEDKFIRLYEENLLIKHYARKQDDKIKKLSITQTKLLGAKGTPQGQGIQAENKLEELHSRIRDLERQNTVLKDKLKLSRHQMILSQATRTGAYSHVGARINTGIPKQSTMQTMDPRIMKGLRAVGPSPMQRSMMQNQNPAVAAIHEVRSENRQLQNMVQELQDQCHGYVQEIESLKDQIHVREGDHDEDIKKIKQKLSKDQKANIEENIELIRLQRELREKSSSLTQLHDKYVNLEEKLHRVTSSHDQVLQELETSNRELQTEQNKCIGLQNQLKQGSSSHILLTERDHRIHELESECQILKEAHEKLLSSAFDLEKEREWRAKEKALKLQIAQLEATLKCDVGEKGGILDRLNEERDRQDQLEKEHRELRVKYFELKHQHDELTDKMKYFSKDSALNMDELEEALVIVKHRREAQNPELEFLHKVDEEQSKDLEKCVRQLQAEHADTINELEKTRNMLIVQHKINKDYQAEVNAVTKKMDELKREYDLRLNEYAQLLDIRAARIKKLEAQMRDVAYGTRQYRVKADEREQQASDEDDMEETVNLELGQNLFEIHIARITLSAEGLKQMCDGEPNIFCTWEFYEFEIQSTAIQRGPRAEFDFTSQYVVKVDDFFLHYLQKESCVLELHQSFGTDYQTVAACNLRFHELLDRSNGRLHGTLTLTGVSEAETGINYGTIDYWVQLRVPMEQALRLYKERSKAMGYIESNLIRSTQPALKPMDEQAALRAPDNINQLRITVIQCMNVTSRRKDVQPSPFCIYKFFDFPDHDTAIVMSSNSPHFDDEKVYPIAMASDMDKYLKSQALKVYVFDDTDPDESYYLGIATIPLIGLSHDKPIHGTFELIRKDGSVNGTVDVQLQWQYPYLPPTTASKTLKGAGSSAELLPGEKEAMQQSVVAGGPRTGAMSSKPMNGSKPTKAGTGPSAVSTLQSTTKSTAKRTAPQKPSAKSSPAPSVKRTPIQSPSRSQDIDELSEGEPVSGESAPVSESEGSTPRAAGSRSPAVAAAKRTLSDRLSSHGSDVEPLDSTLLTSKLGSGEMKDTMFEEPDEATLSERSERSELTETDDEVVVQSSRPSSSMNNGLVPGDSVRVVVSHVVLHDCDLLHDDNVKMLYVEYHFLGIPLEETETPCALPKPHTAGKPIVFNFAKTFPVDSKNHLACRQLLAGMIVPGHPNEGRLRFALVSEPPEEDEEECVDVGAAYVSMPQILQTNQDVVNKDIPIYSVDDENMQIGVLGVTVECLQALRAVRRELQA